MTSSKTWDLQIDPDVFKSLKKIPHRVAGTVLAVIKLLPANPFAGDIQKMKGENDTWRRRIGSYRIYYKLKVSQGAILVFLVERRTS